MYRLPGCWKMLREKVQTSLEKTGGRVLFKDYAACFFNSVSYGLLLSRKTMYKKSGIFYNYFQERGMHVEQTKKEEPQLKGSIPGSSGVQ